MVIENGKSAEQDPSQEGDYEIKIPITQEFAESLLINRISQTAQRIDKNSVRTTKNSSRALIHIIENIGQIPSEEVSNAWYTLDGQVLHETTLKSMAEYGFDPAKFKVIQDSFSDTGSRFDTREYPSQMINGLTFYRFQLENAPKKVYLETWTVTGAKPIFTSGITRLIPGIFRKI